MPTPKVTFIVPCYKLAHLLGSCVNSILEQSYSNFEILIMDDCSPDNTPEVARSFNDPRVRHIRNEPNLGHLRNYNKGIKEAAGEYIWLISADDRLRKPYALERYLGVMENLPQVGYAFCAGMGLQDERETEIVQWATLNSPDAILKGREFLHRLLESNCVLAPSGLVRRECYEKLGVFPLDLPFAGDWYLWCIFALHYDVAYFSEPMVNYREHCQSMTGVLIAENVRLLCKDDLAVRWRMKEHIDVAGDGVLAKHCLNTIADYYLHSMTSQRWRGARYRMSLKEFSSSLDAHAIDPDVHAAIRAKVMSNIGSQLYWDSEFEADLQLYKLALEYSPANLKLRLKYLMLSCGVPGVMAMQAASTLSSATRRLLSKS